MDRMSGISLTEDQKLNLIEFARSKDELIARRARLILAYAEGKPTLPAAQQAGISRGRARFWKRQFLARGFDIFKYDVEAAESVEKSTNRLYEVDEKSGMDLPPGSVEKIEPGGDEIPFPELQNCIGLQPEDSLSAAGKKVWLFHLSIMLSHEQGTLEGNNIEELHDMRVATRRMRSAFDIFGSAFEPKILKHYLNGLRYIGRALGQVRDMDVILENAQVYQVSLDATQRPGLDGLLDEWKQQIDKRRNKLTLKLASEKYQHFKKEFNHFLQAPAVEEKTGKPWSETTSRLRDIVPVLVYSRYAAVRAYDAIVPIASLEQLHALRIEFKKFRYTLEYFREILGETTGRVIQVLKLNQDHLGELHDADVACHLVSEYLHQWEDNQSLKPIQERISPEPVVTYLAKLHAERYRLLSTYPELWKNISQPEFRQNLAGAISLL